MEDEAVGSAMDTAAQLNRVSLGLNIDLSNYQNVDHQDNAFILSRKPLLDIEITIDSNLKWFDKSISRRTTTSMMLNFDTEQLYNSYRTA